MLHADVIARRSPAPVSAFRDLPGRLWTRMRSLLVAAARTGTTRRAERRLMEMPDYLLKDIGLGRSDIPRAVRQGRG
jgi:uncharacterized protein YjiS (DUF1127 family)